MKQLNKADRSAAAAVLGSIRTEKKANASRNNLKKANAALTPEERKERAKKANAARNSKLSPEERKERAKKGRISPLE